MAKNKTLMYVGIGVGVLVVGGVAYMLFKPKPDDDEKSGGGNTYSGGSNNSGTGVGEKTTAGKIIQFGMESGILDRLFGGNKNKDNNETTTNTIANVPDSVPFTNTTQGNCFRKFVNDNYPTYAQNLMGDGLDRTGSYNNSYMTTAYAKYGNAFDTALNNMSSSVRSACGF
jgi:hypothetical protein